VDEAGVTTMRRKLASLSLPPQPGEATKPLAAQVSGKRYVFAANDAKLESITVEFGADGAVIRARQDGHDTRIPAGRAWQRGDTLLTLGIPEKVAGTGAWTADDTFTAKLAAYETPFVQTVALQFKGDELFVDTEYNVAFGERKRPRLVGKLESK
jgi:hypothetical protein